MTDSHIGLVHVVRGGKVYPLNSGELEVCGLGDVFFGLGQHDRQSHWTGSRRAVMDRLNLCNSGEPEVCGLGDVR